MTNKETETIKKYMLFYETFIQIEFQQKNWMNPELLFNYRGGAISKKDLENDSFPLPMLLKSALKHL